MSYIVVSFGSRALLTDVLLCCSFQRKYRTPLCVPVGPSFTFVAGNRTVNHIKGIVWSQNVLGMILKLAPQAPTPTPPSFDERDVWCSAMKKGGCKRGCIAWTRLSV